MWSAAVTKVSKKRQVRRAISRSAAHPAGETARLPASAGGQAHPARDRRRRTARQRRRARRPASAVAAGIPDEQRGQRRASSEARPPSADRSRSQSSASLRLAWRRGDPVEQVPAADEQPKQRRHDRIQHQPGLVGEEARAGRGLRQRQRDIRAERAKVAAQRDAGMPRHEAGEHRQERRQRERQQDEARPDERRRAGGRVQPASSATSAAGARQRAPQIVEHLPAADRGRDSPAGHRRLHAAEHPRQQLPVAARPAMLARRGDVVAAGNSSTTSMSDTRPSGRTCPRTDRGSASYCRARGPAARPRRRRRRRCPCRCRSLRRTGPGRRPRPPTNRDRCRSVLEKMRWNSEPSRADRQRGRDARLQHAVALDDAAGRRIETRPVERVRHLADQPLGRVARQARVGIEGDDIADVGRQRRAARRSQERRVGRAAQQAVELVELAALALPAHPPALRLRSRRRRRWSRRKRSAPAAFG